MNPYKKFLTILMVQLMLTIGLFNAAFSAEANDKPNVLFCMADDWGWPHAGVYGDKVVQTPHFDRLAREGVLFRHAYISSPSCTPSRNAIVTGQQFYRLGQGASLHSILDTKYPNFMFMFREAGYKIGHYDKAWGPGKFRAGGYNEHPCGPNVEFKQFIQEKDPGEPFCFWLGTTDPHRPFKVYEGIPYEQVEVPDFFPENETVKKDIAAYYYEVQRWDQRVGNALQVLEEAGELDNTIIAMTGDHGFAFPRGKGNLYDYGARVPLAIRWGNRVEGDRLLTDFVSLTDLAPTFLEAAGITVPVQMSGNSLLPVLTSGESGRVDPHRNFMVYGRERHVPAQEYPSMVGYPVRALRTDGWLYILNLRAHRWPAGVPDNATHPMTQFADCDDSPTKFFIMDNKNTEGLEKYYALCFEPRPAQELYDVKNDPFQIHNLAGDDDYRKVLTSMHNKLIAYLRKTEDPRVTGEVPMFDEYPYRAEYLDMEEINEAQKKQAEGKRTKAPF